ncbi:alpha/beta fold hydrolase [Comamonas humi]
MSTTSIPEGKYVDIAPVAGQPQRVHYHEQGSGDAVIFLHGAGTGASGYSNFKGNYPEFAQAGFRTLVPDLLGFGLSSKTEEPKQYDLDFFIAGVKGLVDALGLKNITLLGNSLGGAVALGYALKHPGDVKNLILMAPGGVEDLPVYFAMPGIANMFKIYQEGKTGREAMRAVMSMQVVDQSLLTEAIIDEREPIAKTQTQAARSPMNIPNLTEQLPQLQCKVLAFWGMQDAFNPVGGADKLARGIQNCRVVLVNQCGHWVQVEHRGMFNRTCIDFLQNG